MALVTDDLEDPVYMTVAPGSTALYIVERDGRVVRLDKGEGRPRTVLDIRATVRTEVEEGLHSIAFHPNFQINRLVYVYFNDRDGDVRVDEWMLRDGKGRSRLIRNLLLIDKPELVRHHNGGQIQFGPDGALYAGMGDAARNPYDGGPRPPKVVDPQNNSQDLGTQFGKLFRIDVDQPNPVPQMVAYGLRNPWRFSFDSKDGRLYLADVGQFEWEEVNVVEFPWDGLLNFGWSAFEGREPFREARLNDSGQIVRPSLVYEHDVGDLYCPGNGSIVGGYVYRGRAAPSLRGRYVFGDYCSGEIFSFPIRDTGRPESRTEAVEIPELSSFGLDKEGELYALSLSEGALYRFEGGQGNG